MRLMEILNEVEVIEKEEKLFEVSKRSIKKKYGKDRSKAFKMITKTDKAVTKTKAKAAVSNIKDEKMKAIRGEIVSAFMNNDIKQMTAILNDTKKAREAIDYLVLLKTAHGGEKKLMGLAGKKKTFLRKTFKLIDGISDIQTGDEEEATEE